MSRLRMLHYKIEGKQEHPGQYVMLVHKQGRAEVWACCKQEPQPQTPEQPLHHYVGDPISQSFSFLTFFFLAAASARELQDR